MGAAAPGCSSNAIIVKTCLPLILIILFSLIALVLVLFFPYLLPSWLLFFLRAALFIIAFCIIPSIAYHSTRKYGRIAQLTVEFLLFTPLIIGFGFWLSNDFVIRNWMLYILSSTFLIEGGSHIINYQKDHTFERLYKSSSFKHIQHSAKQLEAFFFTENILYISLPVGLTIGLLIGWVRNLQPQDVITILRTQLRD